MMSLARAMPGFRSYEVFLSDSGERLSLVEFETTEQREAWRDLPEHRAAQALGRERFYEEYSLQVCDPVRESRFEREGR